MLFHPPLRTAGFGDERTDPIDPMLNPPNHAQPIFHGPIFKVDSVASKDLLFGISHSLKLLTHSCFIRKTQRPKTLSCTITAVGCLLQCRHSLGSYPLSMAETSLFLTQIRRYQRASGLWLQPEAQHDPLEVKPVDQNVISSGGRLSMGLTWIKSQEERVLTRTTLFRVNHDKALSQPRKAMCLGERSMISNTFKYQRTGLGLLSLRMFSAAWLQLQYKSSW